MISEVDLRDWERVIFSDAKKAALLLKEEGHRGTAYDLLLFIEIIENIRNEQLKRFPALLRPKGYRSDYVEGN